MDHGNADDPTLVAAATAGDLAAFEVLVRRHTQAVYAHALRFFGEPSAAEDVVQEVFVKVFRALDSYDGRAQFSTWLYRVTRNACLDEVRAGKRRPLPVDPCSVLETGGDFADEVNLASAIELGMRALPPEDRDALSAVSLFGLSYAEAGDVLGVPQGTVKSRVFRARRTLAATLNLEGRGA